MFLIIIKGYFKYDGEEIMKIESLLAFFPVIILIFQVIPSLFLVYSSTLSENSPELTVKITGHQWYWSYELRDISNLSFDSFIKPSGNLICGELRLLAVDNSLVVPSSVYLRFCTTSSDVIHSWTLLGLGLKLDSIPGLLNTSNILAVPVGVYFGQCREVCGSNHSFMRICLEVSTWEKFVSWVTLLVNL